MIRQDEGGRVFPDPPDHSPHFVIFAVDPGVTTGWAALRVPARRLGTDTVARVLASGTHRHGQILRSAPSQPDTPHVNEILDVSREIYTDWVLEDDVFLWVIESFSLRMMSMDTALLAPVRVTSIIRDRLWESGVPIFMQSPSDAKNVCTDTRLKTWGLYDRSSGPHARDADRHAVLMVRKLSAGPALRESLLNSHSQEEEEVDISQVG